MTGLSRRALLGTLPLLGWPASARAAEPPKLRVQDTFEVGPAVYVRSLAVEPARGAVWVGTSAGVHEVDLKDGRRRQTFTRAEGLANEYVFAIGITRDGNKWFGTNAGGVSRWRDGRWKTFFPMHGLADYWVYCFAQQRNGDLWIGTWAGASRVDGRTGAFTTYLKELVNEWVYGLAVDAQDRVWFGTEGGVSMFDGQRWRSWTHADGLGAANDECLPFSDNTGLGTRRRHDLTISAGTQATYNPNYVFAMLAAADGSIWAGTWGGGASRWDGQSWRSVSRRDGLAGNIVYALAQAGDGALWFGTDQGLCRWQPGPDGFQAGFPGGGTWQTFGVADGLPDRHVYAIAVAPDQRVWAGTRGGVVRVGP
ncbi:ligand-binding sensor domain-containing protein [Leptothrix discophora]|uniref:Two-component regulator propeller domain-containing protein n=1 Tax=Leptothrix discophora TaxID=89 RepID=A0ABT9FY12_LEPDI|nr:two-component regulator propeller domain-containing protein [Leptothrix discophora]MDP4299120.1 two-component regulator propeller domain-containing protein [Leptothrix discophora]